MKRSGAEKAGLAVDGRGGPRRRGEEGGPPAGAVRGDQEWRRGQGTGWAGSVTAENGPRRLEPGKGGPKPKRNYA